MKISHKKDGHRRQPHRFHVYRPPLTRPLDPLLRVVQFTLLCNHNFAVKKGRHALQWQIHAFLEIAPTPRGMRQIIIWQNFYQKLHENERNWTTGGRASPAPLLDRPLYSFFLLPQHNPIHTILLLATPVQGW